MATTPEGKNKDKIKKILDSHTPDLYYCMIVPNGYGKSTLDFLGCAYGYFFAIEAKKLKGKPTERQDGIIADIHAAGGKVFVINDEYGLSLLESWLKRMRV